jgi:hypothetical protein
VPPLDTYTYDIGQGKPLCYHDIYSRHAMGNGEAHWWYSFIGNVLGTAGQTLHVEDPACLWDTSQTDWCYETPCTGDSPVPMWQLGNLQDGQDPTVIARALRDANFDYVTQSVRWHGIGGTGTGQTPTPTPTLPDSLYLTDKPAFFGSATWPRVDGSNAANPLPGTLPARARFDSMH